MSDCLECQSMLYWHIMYVMVGVDESSLIAWLIDRLGSCLALFYG